MAGPVNILTLAHIFRHAAHQVAGTMCFVKMKYPAAGNAETLHFSGHIQYAGSSR